MLRTLKSKLYPKMLYMSKRMYKFVIVNIIYIGCKRKLIFRHNSCNAYHAQKVQDFVSA